MKKRVLVLAILSSVLLTGCGGSGSYSSDTSSGISYDGAMNGVMADYDSGFTYSEGVSVESSGLGTVNTNINVDISNEMLVYRSNVEIDTLDFDDSVSSFKSCLSELGGFIENESYSDGGSSYYDYRYIESEEKHNTYSALVRVPSGKYSELMSSMSGFGDVRNQQSEVENISKEYSTAGTSLEIYQTKYDRYLDLLSQTNDISYMIELENELTDLEIKIANLKTSMSTMETDVAYSYIQISIREVEKYQEEPEKRDTFLQRIVASFKESWQNLLDFLEGIVIFVIMSWWGILLLVVFIVVVVKLANRGKKVNIKPGEVKGIEKPVSVSGYINNIDKVVGEEKKEE